MVTESTLLIVGAGGSSPYGYPIGSELKSHILSYCKNDLVRGLLIQCGFAAAEIDSFRSAFLKSSKPTIDSFLEDRVDFLKLGKVLIAYAILSNEKEDIFERTNWYQHLFNSIRAKPQVFEKNALSILTYNYDRSLDYLLHSSFVNSYRLSETEASFMKHIPIVHIHGHVGP